MQTPSASAIRKASAGDLDAIAAIYNQGIEDRIATLDTEPKSREEIERWWSEHGDRYAVLLAVEGGTVIGWASLNRFSARCAHAEIADVSIYVKREFRGKGVGFALLQRLLADAKAGGFRKLVLHALDGNEHGKRLYRKAGFREVGVFREHGKVDDRYVDVVAMEWIMAGASGEL